MVAVSKYVAVGLDGQEIPPEQVNETHIEAVSGERYDIEIFDGLPRWAREALREIPKYDVPTQLIAPHIYAGEITRFDIAMQLHNNDAVQRAHFAEKDRANGIS